MNPGSAVLKLLEGISVHGDAVSIVNECPGKVQVYRELPPGRTVLVFVGDEEEVMRLLTAAHGEADELSRLQEAEARLRHELFSAGESLAHANGQICTLTREVELLQAEAGLEPSAQERLTINLYIERMGPEDQEAKLEMERWARQVEAARARISSPETFLHWLWLHICRGEPPEDWSSWVKAAERWVEHREGCYRLLYSARSGRDSAYQDLARASEENSSLRAEIEQLKAQLSNNS